MAEPDDMELLREFADNGSESAFAELVKRHLNMVYSAALRRVGDARDAEEVAQVVFLILARKANRLSPRTVLVGWLYETTRFTSKRLLRSRLRREIRERDAAMQTLNSELGPEEAWARLAPFLEQAMENLTSNERAILAMRFFENKSASETASVLGIGEWAAHKRTTRAVDKLRRFFSKQGVTLTSVILVAAISGNSVQAAPIGLAGTVTTTAIHGVVVSSSTLTLVKGAIKFMAWSKTKTVIGAAVVLLLAGTATVILKSVAAKRQAAEKAALRQRFASIPGSVLDNSMNRVFKKSPHRAEILKLRAEVWPGEKRAREEEIKARQQVNDTTDAVTIDLKPYVNTKLADGPLGDKGDNSDNLAQLPTGTHIFGGVPFDVEGAVYLTGGWLDHYKKGNDYPARVKDIRIDRQCSKIHILHGAGLISFEMAGQPIGQLVLHFSDGSKSELRIVPGVNVWDWWAPLFKTGVNSLNLKTDSLTEPAWVGMNPMIKRMQPDESLVLYRTTFINPHSNLTLSTIDYVSDKTISVPFMVGLTVE